jgi:hypothetical protein
MIIISDSNINSMTAANMVFLFVKRISFFAIGDLSLRFAYAHLIYRIWFSHRLLGCGGIIS